MGKYIMVVDDCKSVREILGTFLRSFGYNVLEAETGIDALSKLNGQKIDLFICDVNMPDMDGITCLSEVKKNELFSRYKFVPFLMLTTELDKDLIVKAKKEGAMAWLIKPFNPDQLFCTIKKIIG